MRRSLSQILPGKAKLDHKKRERISLTRMGTLYIAASICQASWLYHIGTSLAELRQLIAILPSVGWGLILLSVVMCWCGPHLFLLGVKMIRLSLDPEVIIRQNRFHKEQQRLIATLLSLGIMLDLVILPLLYHADDKGIVLLLAGLMGGRVVLANLIAISEYYSK